MGGHAERQASSSKLGSGVSVTGRDIIHAPLLPELFDHTPPGQMLDRVPDGGTHDTWRYHVAVKAMKVREKCKVLLSS